MKATIFIILTVGLCFFLCSFGYYGSNGASYYGSNDAIAVRFVPL